MRKLNQISPHPETIRRVHCSFNTAIETKIMNLKTYLIFTLGILAVITETCAQTTEEKTT